MNWNPIWYQNMTMSLGMGMVSGKDRTVVFQTVCPFSGEKIRMKFSNRYGMGPYELGSVVAASGDRLVSVTKDGEKVIGISQGEQICSDEIPFPVQAGDVLEVRIYFTTVMMDSNMTEEDAVSYPGDVTGMQPLPEAEIPELKKLYNMFDEIVSLTEIDVLTEQSTRVIAAFGDSITAMGRWVRPLQKRLHDRYGSEYTLLNAGISGNCLLYEVPGMVGASYGEKGIARFDRDVMSLPDLYAVIIGIGINDISFYTEQNKEEINFDKYCEAVTGIVSELRAKNVRVIMQTLSPRKGFPMVDLSQDMPDAEINGEIPQVAYSDEMEALRNQMNDWIRSCGLFDYVFDADAVMRDPDDPSVVKDGLHQGDFLHPNRFGGQVLADAWDLGKLTGEE